MDKRIYDNYVLQVAEQGSLTKAASALGISQPALSSGLNSLEKETGIRIFNRRSVPVTFTPEGKIYYDYIRRLQLLSDDFSKRIDALREDGSRRVTVGAPAVYTESVVTDAVIRLKKEHPDYQVRVRSASLADLIEDASCGRLDCFISTSDNLPGHFEKQPIRTERLFLVIPRNDPVNDLLSKRLQKDGTPDYSVLSGQPFILPEEGQPLQKQVAGFLRDHRIRTENSITTDQVSTAVGFSLKGAGICFASEEALERNIRLDSVRIYPLPDYASGRTIYVAYDRDLVMTDACRRLTELLTMYKL